MLDADPTDRSILSVPFICPSCRGPEVAAELDANLTCTNADCSIQYPELTETIPLVATPETQEVIRAFDAPRSAIEQELTPWIESLSWQSPAWQQLAIAGTYVWSHYADADSPFAPLAAWALGLVEGPVERALDLGCGPGRMAMEVARRTGAAVIGLDYNPYMLRWARLAVTRDSLQVPRLWSERRFRISSLDTSAVAPAPGAIRWLCADGLAPPLPCDAFDLVTTVSYLDNVPDPSVALGQAAAMLRPGGHLLMATPDAWTDASTPHDCWIADSVATWLPYLEGYGLSLVAVKDELPWILERTPRVRHHYQLYAMLARKL